MNPVIPTERVKGATRNLQFVLRSLVEPEVYTLDPHVASLLRMTNFGDFKFIIYVTTPLRMTGLGLGLPFPQICHSDRKTVRFRRGIYSLYVAVKFNPKYLLEILTSVISSPPQDDGFWGFQIYYLCYNSIKDDYLDNIIPLNLSFRQRNR